MQTKPSLDELFERRLTFPDFEPQERLALLVGLDDPKERVSKILGLLVAAVSETVEGLISTLGRAKVRALARGTHRSRPMKRAAPTTVAELPVAPPLTPMEATPVAAIPTGAGWQYEPK